MTVSNVRNSASPNTQPSAGAHTVRSGDTLSGIAAQHGVGLQDLIAANPQIRNPDLIYPGQSVNLPERAAATGRPATEAASGQDRYTVRAGDTLSGIADKHGISLGSLANQNPQLKNLDLIHPGQQLNLPPGVAAQGASHADRGRSDQPPPAPVEHGGLSADTIRARVEGGAGSYTVQAGDTMSGIAGRHGVGLQALCDANPQVRDPDRIYPGQQLSIPPGGHAPTTTPSTPAAPTAPAGSRDVGDYPRLGVYPPGAAEQVQLFEAAARRIGVPESWARSEGLQNILRRESNGRVGVPNYTYGERARDPSQWGQVHDELKQGRITARSSATGLGQLLLSNVDRHYPDGRAGIGDPLNEAAGMLSYIRERYGNPDQAWREYGVHHEGY